MYNKQKAKAKELTTMVIPVGTNLLSNVNNTFLPSLADKIHTHTKLKPTRTREGPSIDLNTKGRKQVGNKSGSKPLYSLE